MADTKRSQRGSRGMGWPARKLGTPGRAFAPRRDRGTTRSLGIQQLESRIAFAIAPSLVADLNTIPNSSYPTIGEQGSTVGVTPSGLLFLADDHVHGNELWISNGTAAGTSLLKDANPGRAEIGLAATSPLFNGAFYAIVNQQASDPWSPNATQLWKTDGTAAGTVFVKELSSSYAYGGNFVTFSNALYFDLEGQVWKTDGTGAGTVKVAGFGGPSTGATSVDLFVLGDALFGLVDDSNGATLYRMSLAGVVTQVVALPSVTLNTMSGPIEKVIIGNRLLFAAADGDQPPSLWATDGTAAGTGPVFAGGAGPSYPNGFTLFGSSVYFTGEAAASGSELWRTDGAAAGTSLVKDIEAGSASSFPGAFTVAGGKLFFRAMTAAAGDELWVSDGTTAGTRLVKDIATGANNGEAVSSSPSSLTPFTGKLFFSANGNQLWKSDGTAVGTVLVKDITPTSPTTGSGGFGAMAEFNGRLFFPADDGVAGNELWSSDGSTAGTKLVKDVAPGDGDGVPGGSASYLAGAALGSAFIFAGDDGVTGLEVYKRDANGTVSLVKDIAEGGFSYGYNVGSRPEEFTAAGGAVYFGAEEAGFGPTSVRIWKTDGTAAGTVPVGEVSSSTNGRFGFTSFGGAVIFCADTANGRGIYRTDGTDAGTVLVADGFDTEEFTVWNGKLYFSAYDNGGTRIYGMATPASTPVRAAFDDGSVFAEGYRLAAVGNRLFIEGALVAGEYESHVFVTDGTASGTRSVTTAGGVLPGIYGSPRFTPAAGTLFFTASTPETGTELWRTQTVAGVETAVLVKDITPGTDDSIIDSLVADGTRASFLVKGTYDAPTAPVLWETDGTTAGTKPATIVGGQQPTVLGLSPVAGGRIFAVAADQTHGTELWALDIVAPPGAPTALVAVPGAASVALSWTAPATGGRPITDYVIQYRRASVATWSTFADPVSSATTATVTGLIGGANYLFRVVARNDVGDGLPSASIAATVPTPPGAPTGLTAIGGVGQAVLNWSAPVSAGSTPITDYVIQFRRASVATWSVFADGVSTARTATVTGLAGGANYLFRVTARNAIGDGPPSGTAVATILMPPSPPQWVSAVAGAGTATLAWTLPANQGSSPVSDYVVQFRRLSSAVWSTFDDGVSTTRTTTVTGLVRGANYAFRIIARSAAGDGAPSGQRSLTIG